MTDVIYLAPLCQKHERMWCEHDAPVDCECVDGPHPWIKYIAALRQPTQSDCEVAASIRSALYRACSNMPNFPVGIVEPFVAAHHRHGYDQGYYDGQRDRQLTQDNALREALEAAPIINLWESKEDFRRRQDGWLKTKYRAALQEQSK